MHRCEVKRGFLVLHDCGEPPVGRCETCGRRVCAEHTETGPDGMLCIDCQARSAEQLDDLDGGPGWTDRARIPYYQQAGYGPLYVGHHPHAYYDEFDVRAFDADMRDAPHGDGGDDGSFFDS